VAPPVAIDWSNPMPRFQGGDGRRLRHARGRGRAVRAGREVNRSKSPEVAGLLKALGACLGLLQDDPRGSCRPARAGRGRHRGADRRARAPPRRPRTSPRPTASARQLLAQGIVLKDSAAGTTWEAAQ
jgi:cysteinyl-tRNA synthetase